MKQGFKRLCSFVLALCMIISLFPVTAMAATVDVATFADLVNAVSTANDGDIIRLTDDIDVDVSGAIYTNTGIIDIAKDITIDGNGFTLTAIGTPPSGFNVHVISTQHGSNADIIIKNLIVDGKGIAKHGINIYMATAQLSNVTIQNCIGYGLCVNSSDVTATNLNIDDSNGWGAVNVHGKSGLDDASFTLESGTIGDTLMMETDASMESAVTINGGTVSSIEEGTANGSTAVEVNDGNVASIADVDSLTINGGTVTAVSGVPSITAEFLVVFEVNGEEYATRSVAYGELVAPAVADPSVPGYTFNGWLDAADAPVDLATATINSDTVFHADLTAIDYQATYLDAEGNAGTPETWTYGSTVTIADALAPIEGAEFDYWLGSDGKIYIAGSSYVVSILADLELTPVFDNDTEYAEVKFVVDGELYDSVSMKAELDGKYTVDAPAVDPVKTGYTFNGWLLGGTIATFPAEVADKTMFVADFSANTYNVTYKNLDGSDYVAETWTYGAPATIQGALAPIDGAEFEYWLGSDGKLYQPDAVITVDITEDLKLVPVYDNDENYFLVYFYDLDGSVYAAQLMAKEVDGEYEVTTPVYTSVPTAVWKHYAADGTYKNTKYEGATLVDFTEGEYFVVDVSAAAYDVTVNYVEAGTVIDTELPVNQGIVGSNYTVVPTVPAGYKLVNVSAKGDNTGTPVTVVDDYNGGYVFVMPSESVTVSVQVAPLDTFTVQYVDTDNAVLDSQSYTEGTVVTVADYTGTDEGTFLCWVGSDGSSYLPGAELTVEGDVTLSALCQDPDSPIYLVKFQYADGTIYDLQLATEKGGYAVTAPALPEVEGYTELEWRNGSFIANPGDVFTVSSDETYVLQLDKNSHSVTQKHLPTEAGVTDINTLNQEYGSIVSVSIKEIQDYVFDNVTVVGDVTGKAYDINAVIAGSEYNFVMPDEAVTVTVTYVPVPVDSTVINFYVDGGLYDYAIVEQGQTLTAMPVAPTKAGASFLGWENEFGTLYTTEVPTVKGIDSIELTAKWESVKYNVDFVTGTSATIAPFVDKVYGEVVTLPAAPVNDGYVFIGWVAGSTGFIYAEGATYTVTADETFTAKWEAGEYVVRFVDDVNNTICGFEVVEYNETAQAPVVAPTATGKSFLYWEANGDTVTAGQMTAPITASVDYVAVWQDNTYSVTTNSTDVTFTGLPTAAITAGTAVEFTVEAEDGYEVESIVLKYANAEGITVYEEIRPDASGLYSFNMPAADVEIIATAKQNVFNIFTVAGANTNIVTDPTTNAEAGTAVYAQVTASENYVVENVIVMGEESKTAIPVTVIVDGADKYYVFTMPEEDVTVYTSAVKGQFEVTYVDYDNTYLGNETVNSGEYATGKTVSREGYSFLYWTALPGTGAEYQLDKTPVTGDLVLKAVYEGNPHGVTAGLVENIDSLAAYIDGGASADLLNGSGVNTLPAKTGDKVLFTVAATFNYTITDVAVVSSVDGSLTVVDVTLRSKEVKADGLTYYTYAFTMPDEDVKIDIYTEPKQYKVSVVEYDPANGTYTINGDTTTNKMIAQGETVEIAIEPAPGYTVSVVATYDNGNPEFVPTTENNGTFSFTMVPYDVTVKITYTAIDYVVDASTSNKASYKLVWDNNAMSFIEVESLDPAETSKGYIDITGHELEEIPVSATTNYKIPGDLAAANVGDEVEFAIVECVGYDLEKLTVTYDGGKKSIKATEKDGKYYFTMPAADDVVITAIFVEETYNVVKDDADEANGTVTINALTETSVAADYKELVTVKVTPDTGYYVKNISYTLADGSVKDFDKASYTGTMTQDVDDTAHTIEFHMPASDVELNVEYGKIDYSITTDVQNATVTVVDKATVGEEITVTTKSDYGYIITSVYAEDEYGVRLHMETDATSQIYGAEYRFTMPASPVKITVKTVKDTYNVKYLNEDGSFFGGESVEYLDTASIDEFTAQMMVLKPGYHFVGWTSADTKTAVTVPSINEADFVIWQDTVIKANFERDEIDVYITEAANGTVTITEADGVTVVNEGEKAESYYFKDEVVFTAVPDVGYEIDEVVVTYVDDEGDDQTLPVKVSGNDYTIKLPATEKANAQDVKASDVTVTVTFRKAQFTLSKAADCENNGTIAVNGKVTTETSFTYEYDAEVIITATPNIGYYVTSIVATYADGTEVKATVDPKPALNTLAGNSQKLTFNMPAQNVTYKVTYGMIDYGITTVADATKGSVSTDPAEKTTMGHLVTATVVPMPGYKLESITATYEGGNKSCVLTQIADDQFTFNMPATEDNVIVEAIFTEITYTANLTVVGEGEVTLNGYYTDNMYSDYLDTVTVNVAPAEGWQLKSITVTDTAGNDIAINEAIQTTGGDYTFTMPHYDVVVDVVLVKTVYTISTSANAVQGEVTTDPVGTAVVDQIVEVTVTPKPGYKLDELTVTYEGGEKSCVLTQTGADKYTFTMPAANVLVKATFTEVTYVADLVVSGQGEVTLNGYYTDNMNADYLDVVRIDVTPAAGWALESIAVNGGSIKLNEAVKAEGGRYTFVMPEKDVEVEVKLVKVGYDLESFAINFYEAGHGTVKLSPSDVAYVGDKVDIAADPDDGYRLKAVTVTDAEGNAVPVSFVSGDPYHEQVWSFTMPASAVDVVVIFEVDASSYYTDVRTDHWFYEAVTYVTDRGYFLGVEEDLFGPYINMNRAMFVTVLGRIEGVDPVSYPEVAFADVEAGSYYAPYVAWAAANGIVLGRSATEFDPYGEITREEMVAIMCRYAEYLGMDVTPEKDFFMDRYTDVDDISAYAEDYVRWAVGVGLIRGRTDSTIDPLDLSTRAEVAQVVKNFLDKVIAP